MISPGLRQTHAGKMNRVLDNMEKHIKSLRQLVAAFDRDGDVIPAVVVELAERDMGSLIYYAGQANGALTLHDMEPQPHEESQQGDLHS